MGEAVLMKKVKEFKGKKGESEAVVWRCSIKKLFLEILHRKTPVPEPCLDKPFNCVPESCFDEPFSCVLLLPKLHHRFFTGS